MFAELLRFITRKNVRVDFHDLMRALPVSTNFGWERGTPIDRYYIENFFRANGPLIRGRVLEVGDTSYSRKFSTGGAESFHSLHVTEENQTATIIGDLTDSATLPAGAFDCFVCAQTLQYTFEVAQAVRGAHQLLKPGGVLLATVPGISQISRQDADAFGEYWRFTTDSITRLFEPIFGGDISVQSVGNVLAATAFLQGLAFEDLPDPTLLDLSDRDYQLIVTVVARKEV